MSTTETKRKKRGASVLSVKEAAERLGIDHASVNRLIRNGVLRARRAGYIYLTTAAAVEAVKNRKKSKGGRPRKYKISK